MQNATQLKPFKTYEELTDILSERGMTINDLDRARRKLSQVGYYRLSGYWYPAREIEFGPNGKAILCPLTNAPKRTSNFLPNTVFEKAFSLYLFDKRLRQLMLNAIERIEIHVRSVIAHELGYHDPLAYQNATFINNKYQKTSPKFPKSKWESWQELHDKALRKSKEDSILWHKKSNKPIPIWVATEAWDFGLLSHLFIMLNGKHQNRICQRLGEITPKSLQSWLHEINILRNRCAHHARIWNRKTNNPLNIPDHPYFNKLALSESARSKIFGLICVIWYLVHRIGPSSEWLKAVSDLVNSFPQLPNCHLKVMGFPDKNRFPDHLFSPPPTPAKTAR